MPAGTDEARWTSRAQGAIGWVSLWCVLLSALALGANRPAAWMVLVILVLALFAAQLLLDALSGRDARLDGGRLLLPTLLYLGVVLWGIAQLTPGLLPAAWAHPAWGLLAGIGVDPVGGPVVSADPDSGRHVVLRLAAYAGVFWIVASAAWRPSRARAFLRTIAVFSGALAGFGLLAWALGTNPIAGGPDQAERVVRASFINRNSYATYAAFGLIANLAALMLATGEEAAAGDRRRFLREALEAFFAGGWVYAAGAVLCAAAIALSQSRAGAGAAVIGVAVFVALYRRRGDAEGRALAGIALVLLAFTLVALSSGLFARVFATEQEEARFLVYPLILDQALERVWLGHGLGAFQEVFRARVPFEAATAEWDKAHNSYLENLFELGLPATAALYLALGKLILACLRGALIRRRDRVIPTAAVAVSATALTHSLVDFSLQMPAAAALYATVLGLGCAQSRPRD